MTAAEIATVLGAARRCGAWWRCRCPAHDSRSATLALRDGPHDLIVKCFAGCAARDVIDELRRRGLSVGNRARLPEFPESTTRGGVRDDVDRVAVASHIWGQTQEARGTPVSAYLAGREITMPIPPSVRWAPSLRRWDGLRGPAMVAEVEHVEGGFVGVHRTWLAMAGDGPRWRRLDRASLGPIGGGAVRLGPVAELVMVAEGIETALSAMQATDLPAWAALSTSGMISLVLPPLPLASMVVILADNDTSRAGERAARSAAGRWLAEGRRVRIAMPPEPGTDFNDMLLMRTHGTVMEARHAP